MYVLESHYVFVNTRKELTCVVVEILTFLREIDLRSKPKSNIDSYMYGKTFPVTLLEYNLVFWNKMGIILTKENQFHNSFPRRG